MIAFGGERSELLIGCADDASRVAILEKVVRYILSSDIRRDGQLTSRNKHSLLCSRLLRVTICRFPIK
jgi:hypothetical protein